MVVYKTTNIECLPDPSYVENATCFVKAVNWNKAVAQMDCDLIFPLSNTSLRTTAFKKDYSNQYQPFLIDVNFNVCDAISKRNFMAYGVIFNTILKQFTNVNHSCPVDGHLLARNVYIDAHLIPPFPLGFYLWSNIFREHINNTIEHIGTVKFYFQAMEPVVSKKKRN
ncbi:GH25271 [Drosophila grimshawi]|uniref:GH25271 n=1 Tax=Drosophila grimshawi TaxID=7222 RepID=B4K0P4_DROGR|nr:GH25271 [Drosophila grimshawi]